MTEPKDEIFALASTLLAAQRAKETEAVDQQRLADQKRLDDKKQSEERARAFAEIMVENKIPKISYEDPGGYFGDELPGWIIKEARAETFETENHSGTSAIPGLVVLEDGTTNRYYLKHVRIGDKWISEIYGSQTVYDAPFAGEAGLALLGNVLVAYGVVPSETSSAAE